MEPRPHVEAALRGEACTRVPFTIYESMIPQCSAERVMRNRGLCIVAHSVSVYRSYRPNVKTSRHIYWENGREFTRTIYDTPEGRLTTLHEKLGITSWQRERMFKSLDDFRALLFYIQDEKFEPQYESLAEAQRLAGEDIIFQGELGLEPLQSLISGALMGMENFCLQWMENRDEVLKLYQAIVEKKRTLYPIMAESPFLHVNYGGNVVPEIIGAVNFDTYYVPHYNEAAEILHRKSKLIGCHLDANTKAIAEGIARSDLDYIEALTPSPDTDMSLKEARRLWPDKVLWLNFPSSLHLQTNAQIEKAAFNIIDEVASTRGILMGITEDMPSQRWRDSCLAIMAGLERHSREHPEKYRT